jgi:hypothetical protein
MKQLILLLVFVATVTGCLAQRSDYIVLKKRNNRTLKTYFPGSFISATTYSGFTLNGIIREIRNDSIFIEQQQVYQVPTQFGVPRLDTVVYTIGVAYVEITSFNISTHTGIGGEPRQRGFSNVTIPKIMMIGGIGYIVLEVVNTAYRGESLSDGNKLVGLGIAAGVAAAGFVWQQLIKQSSKAGGKYKVVYVNMTGK